MSAVQHWSGREVIPPEQAERDAVMKQRLRVAGLPIVSADEDDWARAFAALAGRTLEAETRKGLRTAAAARCQRAGLIR